MNSKSRPQISLGSHKSTHGIEVHNTTESHCRVPQRTPSLTHNPASNNNEGSDDEAILTRNIAQSAQRRHYKISTTSDGITQALDFCSIMQEMHNNGIYDKILNIAREYEKLLDKNEVLHTISEVHGAEMERLKKENEILQERSVRLQGMVAQQKEEIESIKVSTNTNTELAPEIEGYEQEITSLKKQLAEAQQSLRKTRAHSVRLREVLTDREEKKVGKMVEREKVREIAAAVGPVLATSVREFGNEILIPLRPAVRNQIIANHEALWASAGSIVRQYIDVPSSSLNIPKDPHNLPLSAVNTQAVRQMYCAYGLAVLSRSLLSAWDDSPWLQEIIKQSNSPNPKSKAASIETLTELKDSKGRSHKEAFIAVAVELALARLATIVASTEHDNLKKAMAFFYSAAFANLSYMARSTDVIVTRHYDDYCREHKLQHDMKTPIYPCRAFDTVKALDCRFDAREYVHSDGSYIACLFPRIINKTTQEVMHPGYALFSQQCAHVRAESDRPPLKPSLVLNDGRPSREREASEDKYSSTTANISRHKSPRRTKPNFLGDDVLNSRPRSGPPSRPPSRAYNRSPSRCYDRPSSRTHDNSSHGSSRPLSRSHDNSLHGSSRPASRGSSRPPSCDPALGLSWKTSNASKSEEKHRWTGKNSEPRLDIPRIPPRDDFPKFCEEFYRVAGTPEYPLWRDSWNQGL